MLKKNEKMNGQNNGVVKKTKNKKINNQYIKTIREREREREDVEEKER